MVEPAATVPGGGAMARFFALHSTDTTGRNETPWLALALLIAAFYGALSVHEAFTSGPYMIQDDARLDVLWMERFRDPGLFPGDPVADYFQSVMPFGFIALYKAAFAMGIGPLVFNKVLPFIVVLVTTAAAFRVSMRLMPVPMAAFAASVLLNHSMWMTSDLASGTPRGFSIMLLLIFLYTLLRRMVAATAVLMVVQGLLYPPATVMSLGILGVRLLRWRRWGPWLTADRGDWTLFLAASACGLAVLIPYAIVTGVNGPVFGMAEARTMPIFQPDGRLKYFLDNPFAFFLIGRRSGFFAGGVWRGNPLMFSALALPFLLRCRPAMAPLHAARADVRVLWQVLLMSLVLFLAAHAVYLKLYVPTRYTQHTLRILLSLAGGMVLVAWVARLARARTARWRVAGPLAIATVLLGFPLALIAANSKFPRTSVEIGGQPALYAFFQAQPKDTLLATLSLEGDAIPAFSLRMTYAGREFAIAIHRDYYREMRRRAIALVTAHYSPEQGVLTAFIEDEGIDFVMLDRDAFRPGYLATRWVRQHHDAVARAEATLAGPRRPALERLIAPCTTFKTDRNIVLDARCLATGGLSGAVGGDTFTPAS